jgi:hypothetical protein
MTKKEQRKLIAETARLRSCLRSEQRRRRQFQEANADVRKENAQLCEVNANLRVERDAADAVLGAAMDEALNARRE